MFSFALRTIVLRHFGLLLMLDSCFLKGDWFFYFVIGAKLLFILVLQSVSFEQKERRRQIKASTFVEEGNLFPQE